MNLLRELADEWEELSRKKSEIDEFGDEAIETWGEWEDEEGERWLLLSEINSELGDLLDYPTRAESTQIVRDSRREKEEYGMQIVDDLCDGEIPGVLRPHIDYVSIAEEVLSNWALIDIEGTDYYVDI